MRSILVLPSLCVAALVAAPATTHVAAQTSSQSQNGQTTQPPPAGALVQPQVSDVGQAGYHLGPGDVVHVDIQNHRDTYPPEDFPIGTDGNINYHDLHQFKIVGLTLRQAEDALKKALADHGLLMNAQVSIDIAVYHSQSVTVQGDVHTGGNYLLTADNMTLTQALSKAGGVNQTAAADIKIYRLKPDVTSANPLPSDFEPPIMVNRHDLDEGRIADPELQDGDKIIVDKAPVVYISGFIKLSEPVTYEPGLTLEKAIIIAGGVTSEASKTVHVRRMVNGKLVDKGVGEKDWPTFILQPEDQIVVRKRWW